jgi:hypothetical protein
MRSLKERHGRDEIPGWEDIKKGVVALAANHARGKQGWPGRVELSTIPSRHLMSVRLGRRAGDR